MNVRELIIELAAIENKELPVYIVSGTSGCCDTLSLDYEEAECVYPGTEIQYMGYGAKRSRIIKETIRITAY